MKRLLPLLLSATLLAGCHIETDAPSPTAAKPPETKQPDVKIEPPKPTTTKTLKHPDRIHQLEDLSAVKVRAGNYEIDAWVMNDDSKRAEGMMFLKPSEVKDTQGMIFIFPEPREKHIGFWMQNTYTPLDIIYIGTDHRVVNVGKGIPLNETNVPANGPYQYVLELKQGMAQKFGIKPGTQIDIPAEIAAEG